MKNPTIARGYRLKASTHRLIKKVQLELNSSQDKIIARAVSNYYNDIKRQLTEKNNVSLNGKINKK